MKYKIKTCQRCQATFTPNSSVQKFCHDCKIGNRKEWLRNRDHERSLTPEGKAAHRVLSKAYDERTKLAAFETYGGTKCACCGEDNVRFLTIDHVRSDGAEHKRQTNGRSRKIYRWLKANHYPDGFQVLCYNCNCGRAMNGGTCPHEEMVTHE